MSKGIFLRLAGVRRHTFAVVVALMAPLACLGAAATASAAEPAGDFAVFNQCPLSTPGLTQCLYAQTTGGEYVIGHTAIPITKTVTLQGGVSVNEETGVDTFVAAANGQTLSRTPEPVPGGLFGTVAPSRVPRSVRRVLDGYAARGLLGLTATLELARPASAIALNELSLITQEGTAQSVPVRIKLDNPFLGRKCFIGSSANPIVLNLTTGTTTPPAPNQPISGKFGELEIKGEGSILVIINNTLVDNSFSAPRASGCGGFLSFIIDRLIDSKIDLPSPAGSNTAIQNGSLEVAGTEAVVASEQ
jgi:hypothetical protein